jgi:hypothetical protein
MEIEFGAVNNNYANLLLLATKEQLHVLGLFHVLFADH